MKITKPGIVTITPDGWVQVSGFETDDTESSHIAGCRTVALLAAAWAIERLTEELRKTIAKLVVSGEPGDLAVKRG